MEGVAQALGYLYRKTRKTFGSTNVRGGNVPSILAERSASQEPTMGTNWSAQFVKLVSTCLQQFVRAKACGGKLSGRPGENGPALTWVHALHCAPPSVLS
eukprot:362807-Chlamydomonas_euryale.AAC.2